MTLAYGRAAVAIFWTRDITIPEFVHGHIAPKRIIRYGTNATIQNTIPQL